ncbi:MAG: hypothetical protein WCJ92_06680 [Alphaproteobacteria bacterium]
MLLKIFLVFVTCFSASAMDFVEFYSFLPDSPKPNIQRKSVISAPNSPTKSPTVRKSVKKQLEQEKTHVDIEYQKLEEANEGLEEAKRDDDPNLFLCFDGSGYISAVYVRPTSVSSPPEESLAEINQSLKISKMFYRSHAIANTFFLSGAFCQLPSEFLDVSGLYFCWCGAVYGAFSIDTNKKYLKSQNLESQNILTKLISFQRTQACLNMLAGVCFIGGGIAEAPMISYTLSGLALVAAAGNSIFWGCAK